MFPSALSFIVGLRRSGTTLVNSILCSDPAANPQIGEAQPLLHFLEAIGWCAENHDRMTRHYLASRFELEEYGKFICQNLIERCWNTQGQPPNLILKNPELAFHIERLLSYFSSARFVVCVRDPRDQIASEHDVIARRSAAGSGERFLAMPLTQKYVSVLNKVLQSAKEAPDRFCFVRYEDLVSDPRRECERLAEFCNLDLSSFEPDREWQRMAVSLDDLAKRPSFSKLYGQPVSPTQVGRFRQVLSKSDIEVIERMSAPLMAQFRYDPINDDR